MDLKMFQNDVFHLGSLYFVLLMMCDDEVVFFG